MKIRGILAVLCAAVLLAGCGKAGTIKPVPADSILAPEETPAPVPDQTAEVTPAPGETEPVPAQQLQQVFIILPSLIGQSAVMLERLEEAAKNARIETVVRSSENDLAKQQAAFDEAIRTKASLIICDNLDDQVTTASVTQARAAGVPVFLMNRGIDTLGLANAQILTDNFSCVRELGKAFIEYKNDASVYVELDASGGAYDITEAFGVALAGHEDMKLVRSDVCDEYDKKTSYDLIWEMLHDTPEADALVCYNVTQTKAGLEAAADLGMTLTVVCLNGDDDEIGTLVKNGSVFSSVVKPGEGLADKAISLVTNYLLTGELPSSECVYVRGLILTEENAALLQTGEESREEPAEEEYDEYREDGEEYWDEDEYWDDEEYQEDDGYWDDEEYREDDEYAGEDWEEHGHGGHEQDMDWEDE